MDIEQIYYEGNPTEDGHMEELLFLYNDILVVSDDTTFVKWDEYFFGVTKASSSYTNLKVYREGYKNIELLQVSDSNGVEDYTCAYTYDLVIFDVDILNDLDVKYSMCRLRKRDIDPKILIIEM